MSCLYVHKPLLGYSSGDQRPAYWPRVMTGLSQRALAQSGEVVIRIEVEDRSEDTIDRAAREALQTALLKRSGDRALLQHPAVEAALASARTQLSLYQFERIGGMTRFVAQIDQAVVENLIKAANGTFWAEARPPILLWLVIDDPAGRRFGNAAAEQPLWERLSESLRWSGRQAEASSIRSLRCRAGVSRWAVAARLWTHC